MSAKTGEYRYSLTARRDGSATSSHEDAKKDYGTGTSDFHSQRRDLGLTMTVRFDDLAEQDRILTEDLPALVSLAQALGNATGDALAMLLPSGAVGQVAIEQPAQPAAEPAQAPNSPQGEPQSAQQARTPQGTDATPAKTDNAARGEIDPYAEVRSLLKQKALPLDAWKKLKDKEKEEGSLARIPKAWLVAFLKSLGA